MLRVQASPIREINGEKFKMETVTLSDFIVNIEMFFSLRFVISIGRTICSGRKLSELIECPSSFIDVAAVEG